MEIMNMTKRTLCWSIVLVIFLNLVSSSGVSAQAPISGPVGAPSPATPSAPDCMTAIFNMSDCLTFVEAGSKLKTPAKACCPELAGLVESNPICLCQLLGNSSTIGIQLDVKKAIKLPTVCKVDTPPVSLCAEIGLPVNISPASQGPTSQGAQPISSMGAMGPMAPMAPMGPMAPSSTDGKDGSSSIQISTNIFLVGVISMISFFF